MIGRTKNRMGVETTDWPGRERTGELSGEMAQNGGKMRKRKQLKLKGNKKVKMWGEFRRENLE